MPPPTNTPSFAFTVSEPPPMKFAVTMVSPPVSIPAFTIGRTSAACAIPARLHAARRTSRFADIFPSRVEV